MVLVSQNLDSTYWNSGQIKTKGIVDGEICPHYYWCQVQQQLKCCALEKCDFWQCSLIEYSSEEQLLNDETETLRFAPSPDTSYTGYLSYYKAISALSSSNTSNWMLANHPSVYLYGSLFHAANFLGGMDPQQVQNWLAMYSTALERCEQNDKQDSYGGAPVTQRTDVQTDLSFYRNR